MGPYGWLRKTGEPPPAVGPNIADSVGGFPAEFLVPKELDADFAKWAAAFESGYDKDAFDWLKWNAQGIELAARLKRVVGERYGVEYHYPYEDPRKELQDTILVID